MSQRGTLLFGLVVMAALALALCPAGCGGGGSSSGGANTAQLKIALTDASGTYASVVLAVKEVRIVPAGQGDAATGTGLPLIASFTPAQSVDVLTLAYQQQVLGQAAVPVGTYEQIRLVLAPNPATGDPVNYATLPGDPNTKLALKTPSGQESGLKIVGKFTVTPGILNAVALEFNPEKSIVSAGASGKIILKPTGIRTVQMSTILPTYGSLSGVVLPVGVWPSATVSILPPGGGAAIAMGSVSPDDGTFRAFVPPGSGYTVRVTNPEYNPYDSALLSPPLSYAVTQGADTPVGTITLNNKGSIAGTVLPSGAWTTAVVSVLPAGGGAAVASGAVSAADGAFSLPVPPGSGYTLQVTATGFVAYDTALLSPPVTFTVVALTATSAGTITLTPSP